MESGCSDTLVNTVIATPIRSIQFSDGKISLGRFLNLCAYKVYMPLKKCTHTVLMMSNGVSVTVITFQHRMISPSVMIVWLALLEQTRGSLGEIILLTGSINQNKR